MIKMSHKRKNTYRVTFNALVDMGLFSYSKTTPIPLVTINGQKQENNTGWIKSRHFPNPCANDMALNHKSTLEKMGAKLATTIIEYLDKETNKPVVQLYPESMYIFDGYEHDYKSHLNHATRRDLTKELEKRMAILNRQYSK